MAIPDYPDAALEYVQAQGWTTSRMEIREGAYIIAGSRETNANSETMLLMAVCDPEDQVTADHLKYLVKTGREKNANSVSLTHTVDITEKARKVREEYDIGVIDSKNIQSQTQNKTFEPGTDEISMPDSEPETQSNSSFESEIEEQTTSGTRQSDESPTTDTQKDKTLNENWWLGLLIAPLASLSGFIFGFWYGVVAATSQPPVLIGMLASLTELGGIALAIFVSPILLYLDQKYIKSVSQWSPSKLYYLVVIPYVSIIVSAVYLYNRRSIVGL